MAIINENARVISYGNGADVPTGPKPVLPIPLSPTPPVRQPVILKSRYDWGNNWGRGWDHIGVETTPMVAATSTSKVITLSPLAFLHWQFICHAGKTEACAFGVSKPNVPTYVESLHIPKQSCTPAYCESDDDELLDLLMQTMTGKYVEGQVGRVWLHTHPGSSAQPSSIDETTFKDVWTGPQDFYAMLILARGGETYCRTKSPTDVDSRQRTPSTVRVDWARLPELLPQLPALTTGWAAEYAEKVKHSPSTGFAAWQGYLPAKAREVVRDGSQFGPEFASVYDSWYDYRAERKRDKKRRRQKRKEAVEDGTLTTCAFCVNPANTPAGIVCSDCQDLQTQPYLGLSEDDDVQLWPQTGDPVVWIDGDRFCTGVVKSVNHQTGVALVTDDDLPASQTPQDVDVEQLMPPAEPMNLQPSTPDVSDHVKCVACDQLCPPETMTACRVCNVCDVTPRGGTSKPLVPGWDEETEQDFRRYIRKTYGATAEEITTPSDRSFKMYLQDYCETQGIEMPESDD